MSQHPQPSAAHWACNTGASQNNPTGRRSFPDATARRFAPHTATAVLATAYTQRLRATWGMATPRTPQPVQSWSVAANSCIGKCHGPLGAFCRRAPLCPGFDFDRSEAVRKARPTSSPPAARSRRIPRHGRGMRRYAALVRRDAMQPERSMAPPQRVLGRAVATCAARAPTATYGSIVRQRVAQSATSYRGGVSLRNQLANAS
jgi:hypothetical protein